MKTAISIPDDVFAEAEKLARRLKKSRSELYSRALREYVARHGPEYVTETLDRLCDGIARGDRFRDGRSEANAPAFALVIAQGEVWWADLPEPSGSDPGFRRPVIVVQGDAFNRSRIDTVVCVPLTSTLRWADAPGNVLLEARTTGLPKDSVADVSQIVTLDKTALTERVGRLSRAKLELVLFGIDVVLGR